MADRKYIKWCVTAGNGCGKAGANLFCVNNGFEKADSFIAKITAMQASVYLGSGEICLEGSKCKRLLKVVCSRAGGGLNVEATVESGVGEVNDEEESQSPNEFPTVPLQKTYTKGMAKGDASLVAMPEGYGGAFGIFVRGMDDALWMATGDGSGNWKGWKSFGYELAAAPSCAKVPMGSFGGQNAVHCAILTVSDGIKLVDMQSGNATSLDGETKHAPSLVYGYHTDGQRILNLFVRANDGQLSVKQFIGNKNGSGTDIMGWQPWRGLGYKMAGAPSCLWMGGNHFDCYYRDANDNTMEAPQVLQGGQAVNLGGKTKKRLTATRTDKMETVRILVKGLDGKLWVKNWTAAGGFMDWKQIPQIEINSQPACLQTKAAPARMTCIDVAADNKIYAINFALGTLN
jgi:hypothetical protein